MALARAARWFALDLLIWYGLAGLFLLLYTGVFQEPVSAVRPHLAVVGLPFACLCILRMALSRLMRSVPVSRAVSAVMLAAFLLTLLLYYALVLIGLRSWGGVVAWNVIPSFFVQAPEVLAAAGLSRWLSWATAAAACTGLVAACWSYLRYCDWTAGVTLPNRALTVALAAAVVLVGVALQAFYKHPFPEQLEPLSLTLFPRVGIRDLEGHPVDPQRAHALDSLEDAARAAYVPAAAPNRRNVILIVVDALRPDHMSVFGYARKTTPALDRLAEAGNVSKVIAHASCGDTICGLLSLADSKVPRKFSFRPFSLYEVLRRNGYRVHMLLSGDHTNFYAMRENYGPVDSFYDGTDARDRYMNDDRLLLDRLGSWPAWDGTPNMFQFHLMSVHVLRRKEAGGEFEPARPYIFSGRRDDTGKPSRFDPVAINYYDNGVLGADAIIDQILTTLGRKGYLGNALVVITADHGESLGEHGLMGHANSVREELLRIPVVFVRYGYRPEELQAGIFPQQIDIAPTLLVELGIPQPRTWNGRPLQMGRASRLAYFEEQPYVGVIDARDPAGTWKYWIDRRTGIEHAFDLGTDPTESHDLLATLPAAVRAEWHSEAVSGVPLMTAGNSTNR